MRHDVVIALAVAAALTVPVVIMRAGTVSGIVAGFLHAAWFAYEGGADVVVAFVLLVGIGVAATRAGRATKEAIGTAQAASGKRAARHVMANATPAALFLVAGVIWPKAAPLAGAAACGALAGSLADTVAGEIGMLASATPRMLLFGRSVPRGTDGAMTLLGLGASFVAAGLVAGAVLWTGSIGFWPTFVGGLVGSVCDSVLGATIERARVIGNEGVNFCASTAAGVAAWGCAWGCA